MSTYVGLTASGPTSSINLTLTDATARVAALLRRNDINVEIQSWLAFVLRELTDNIDFPELRITSSAATAGSVITLVGGWNIYPIPTNFSHMASVHYTDQTLYPSRGWNLSPFPREFFKGDTVDFEMILNRSVPGMGDPLYYAVDKTSVGLANASDGTFGQSYINLTGTVTNGSNIVAGILPSTAGLNLGNIITGAGIPTGTTIQSIDSSTQIHMSANATISQANEGMTSAPAIGTPGGAVVPPAIIIYPAFLYTKKGQLELTYYRLPADWTAPTQVPDIEPRWRHYLIELAYRWGQIMLEKDQDMAQKLAFWSKVREQTFASLRMLVQRTENRTIVMDLPVYGGLEIADRKY